MFGSPALDDALASVRHKLRQVGRDTPRTGSVTERVLLTPSSRSRTPHLEEARRGLREAPSPAKDDVEAAKATDRRFDA